MKNFIRGVVLGSAVGVALFWYGGLPNYFPAVVAVVILIGVLIPLESQDRRMEQLLQATKEIQERLDEMEELIPSVGRGFKTDDQMPFIPSIQVDDSRNPSLQKKRTVGRSLDEVAKKLASMQGR